MSRAGVRGGRGSRGSDRARGRGGRRSGGGAQANLSWDTGEEIDGRPIDLFPDYAVPHSEPLTDYEKRQVNYFLLFRRQVHEGPLYTHRRSVPLDPTHPQKFYGREQLNKRYGVPSKATVDPFTAVQSYSQKFTREERSLPDFGARPVYKHLFPEELHGTLDGDDDPRGGKRRQKRLHLSKVTSIPTAEEIFHMNGIESTDVNSQARVRRALEMVDVDRIADDEGNEGADVDSNAEGDEEDLDLEYDDEDAGDYDAEHYFEGGDDDDMGDGDDGGEEATY